MKRESVLVRNEEHGILTGSSVRTARKDKLCRRRALRTSLWCAFSVLMFVALTRVSCAQINTGSLIGTVTDSSGAVIPNARVTLTNVQTGVQAASSTNSSGQYAFRGLIPGLYRIAVEASGFTAFQETNIPVRVAESNTRNVQLAVGQTKTVVTVSAPTVALQTTSSSLGEVIGEHLVRDVPLNGRNFTQLLTLTAGVSAPFASGSWGNPQSGTYIVPSINGQDPQSTQWLLDGTNNTANFGGGISVAPIIDNIQEMKVVSHSDSVQYGGALGGYVDVVTKSGTNQFHGEAWEFLRNSTFDARNPFIANVNPLKQNQFGGNFGGPIIKNKLFFFGSYQGFRQSVGNTAFYLVPTPAMEAGDFSGQLPIYNPYSTRPNPNDPGTYIRDPFPNNQIPQSLLSPLAEKYATLFPKPVNTGVPGTNGIDPRPNIFGQDFFEGRGDYHISPAQSLSVTYNHITSPLTETGGMVGSTAFFDGYGYNVGANYTWTINPTTVLHAAFGRTWIDLHFYSKWDNIDYDSFVQPNWPWACGRSLGFGSDNCWAPMMQITGYAAVNNYNTNVGQTDIYQFTPSLEHVMGKHTLTFGGTVARHRIWAHTQRAFEYFGSNQTADLSNPANTGSAVASFFLGVPFGGDRADTFPGLQQPTWSDGFYAQDQWRANKKLTLNYGLRWDIFNPGQYGEPGTSNYYSGVMDLLTGTYVIAANPGSCAAIGHAACIPTPNGVLPPHVVVAPNHKIFKEVYNNFAPRVGMAYRIGQKMVLRAGIGRYYDTWSDIDFLAVQSEGLWPDSQDINSNTENLTTVQTTIANPANIPVGNNLLPDPNGPFDISGQNFRDPNLVDPWVDEWDLGIQRQFGLNTILSVNYVGSNGRNIPVGGTYGSAVTPGPGNPTLREPFPYILPTPFTRDWGRDWYDALQVTLQHQFSHGLSYSLAYTWSKSLDLGSTDGTSGNQQNPYNLAEEKGVTNYNLPQVFTGAWVYDLPFGTGNLASSSRAANAVIRGWALSGILQLSSGAPYGVFLCGDIANVGRTDCYERPNLAGNPNVSNQTIAEWFNPSAFSVPAQYTYGNVGVNTLSGDGFSDLDISLLRNIQITERFRLQARADAFNAFNKPTWGNPINQLNLPGQTGVVTNTRSTERELQFALKLFF